MTDCTRDDMRDRLPDLLNERLDAATRAEVARHVASCAECAAELAILRSMRNALAPAPRVDVRRIAAAVAASRGTAAREARVRPLDVRQPSRFDRRLARRIAAAFAVAAIGLGTWTLMHRQRAPEVAFGDHLPAPTRAQPAPAAPIFAAKQAAPASHPAPPPTTSSTAPQTLASTRGLVMDGGVTDLSEGDMKILLQSLDSLTAIPDADPAPMSYHIDVDGGAR